MSVTFGMADGWTSVASYDKASDDHSVFFIAAAVVVGTDAIIVMVTFCKLLLFLSTSNRLRLRSYTTKLR